MSESTDKGATGIIGPVALLIGSIVGAGIFALPAAGAKSGIGIMMLWGFLLTGVVLLLHLMFAEVVVRTRAEHRMPGYVGIYLGSKAKFVSTITTVIGSSGALLVYLILFEQFISAIVPSIPGVLAASGAWAILATLVFLGIKTIEKVELFMTAGLIGVVVYLAVNASSSFDITNLHFSGDNWLLPFGVLLFALPGLSAIPEMRPFFIGREKKYARAIIIGSLTAAALYAVFTIAFVGAFGDSIGANLTDSVALLGRIPLLALTVFGLMAIFTSFLVIGSYLVNTLHLDIGLSRKFSFPILVAPLVAYLLGARDFIALVAIFGAIFSGADAFFLLNTWRAAKRKSPKTAYAVRVPSWVVYPLLLLFGVGVILVLWQSIT